MYDPMGTHQIPNHSLAYPGMPMTYPTFRHDELVGISASNLVQYGGSGRAKRWRQPAHSSMETFGRPRSNCAPEDFGLVKFGTTTCVWFGGWI